MKKLLTILLVLFSFTAMAQPCADEDTVRSNAVTLITATSARINGSISHFASGYTTLYLQYVRVGQTDTATTSGVSPLRNLTGLQPNTQYYYYYKTICVSGTNRQLGPYYFTTAINTVVYATERSTKFPYAAEDSGLKVPRADTSLYRAPDTGGGDIMFKTSDKTMYYYNGTRWTPMAVDSGGYLALLNNKVDSVTVDSVTNRLYYWKMGVSYGYALPLDSAYVDATAVNDSTLMLYRLNGDSTDVVIAGAGGTPKLSSIRAASASNDIDNGNFPQIWRWNSLNNQNGLSLMGVTTGSISPQSNFSSIITGNGATNKAAYLSASGGTNNYALIAEAGLVGIGTSTPDASAQLDVRSTTRGVKFPTLSGAQMTAISSPATGLIVYNSDSTALCFYNGSAWLKVSQGGGGSGVTSVATTANTGLLGGTITSTGTLYIDTLLISTRAWRKKLADSLGALIGAAANLGNSNLTQTGGNRTFTGAGQNLIFNGSGGTSLFNVEYNSIILTAENSGIIIQGDSIIIDAESHLIHVDSLLQSVAPTNKMVVWDSVGKKLYTQAIPTGGGSGTVNSGTQYRLAFYAAAGTAVSEAAAITASRALVSDANGVPAHATTTATEIGYVNGVTSAIQTQLNGKQSTITFGTGVLTALGVNIGSAGAPVLFNGAGGTPSSLTGTNITGVPLTTGLTGGNWKTIYTNGSGVITELALGTSGQVLTSNGTTSAPTWETPSAGSGLTVGTSAITSGTASRLLYETTGNVLGEVTGATSDGTKLILTKPSIDNIEGAYATTATAAGTTTLTVSSKFYQNFTGSTTQTVVMPDATTLTAGMQFQVNNNSTGVVTVNANGGTLLRTIGAGNSATFTVTDVSTSTGVYTVSSSVEDWSWIKQSATYTLTSTTSSQKLFNASTNGAFTVEAGTTYFFECLINLSSMSATSGNAKFDILGAGTATFTSVGWSAIGNDNTTPGTSATSSGSYTAASISTSNIVAAATGTGMWAKIEGIMVVNAGGTIIPSVALITAAAAVVGVNTHFKIRKVGTGNTYGNFN